MTPVMPFWALCFHTNSNSPRAERWYYLSRAVTVDGETYAIGARIPLGNNLRVAKAEIAARKMTASPLLWTAPKGSHFANQIVHHETRQ